jgi:hypothetical protein
MVGPLSLAVEISDFAKRYTMGQSVVRALNGVTITLEAGEFAGLDHPTSGGSRVFGRDIGEMFAAVMIPLARARAMGPADLSGPQGMLGQLSDQRIYSGVTVKVPRAQDTEVVEKRWRARPRLPRS